MSRADFPWFIDSTARKELVACEMKFYYSDILKIRPKGGNIHLHFGGCLARGLEVFRKKFYGENAPLDECFAAGTEAIILQWDAEEPEFAHEKKTLATCLHCFYDFFREYPPAEDPAKPVMINGEPAVEFSFAVPIPGVYHPVSGEPMLYTGRFDMLAEYNNAVMVNDEKTTTMLGSHWQQQWKMASQITGYIWAARQYGHNVQGAIIRGISPRVKGVGHQFVFESRSDWQIERWLRHLQRNTLRAIEAWENDDYLYNLDEGCANWGGCPYMPLCLSNNPETWIASDFEKNHWDPLEKAEK